MSTHEQFADDLALYAAGALGPNERAEMDRHLEDCAACRRELEQLHGDAALLALSAADAAPPARARQRLMAAIGAEPRARRAPETTTPRGAWWTWLPSLAAGALAALALVLWLQTAALWRTIGSLEQRVAEEQEGLQKTQDVLATLSDPSAAQFTLTANPAARQPEGKAIYQSERRSLVFLASHMPALGAGKTYELWLIPTSGAPIPVGLFEPDAMGSATVIGTQGPALPAGVTAKAFAVTVEPQGGSAAPTSQPVMQGSGA